MKTAVTGSTGLVGSALVDSLEKNGHEVLRVVRRNVHDPVREISWKPADGEIDAAGFEGVEAVVHLAGENLAGKRWNDKFKEKIRRSRVEGTQLLCEALAGLENKPHVLCSASAIGYYGDRGSEVVDESSSQGEGFLADVCAEWEAATGPARDAGIRVVNLRLGVVLSKRGGALGKMLLPFKLGAGGVVGTGNQYWSWIALDDLVAVIRLVLENESLAGPVNAVSPEPVTNREFTKALGRVLGRPTVLPMPAFAARLALGEMADEMLLASARVDDKVLAGSGFTFQYPELEPALKHALSS